MKKRYYSDEEVILEAQTLVQGLGYSTYTVAAQLNMPEPTVWWHLTHRLPKLDPVLWEQVSLILRLNYRGGIRK